MPSRTVKNVHYNALLSSYSLEYMQNTAAFVALEMAPIIPVEHKSDDYREYDREPFLRNDMRPRGPGTETVGTTWGHTTKTYNCHVFGLHDDIDDQERSNADADLELERTSVEMLTSHAKRQLETSLITAAFTTGVWGTDITGVAGAPGAGQTKQWNDVTSDPAADIDLAVTSMLRGFGVRPNLAVMGHEVFQKAKRNPIVTDQFKYTSADSITEAMLAKVLGIDRIVVSEAIQATNAEGQTLTTDFMIGKKLWVGYVAPNPGLRTATAMATFAWTRYKPMGMEPNFAPVKKFRMEEIESDRLELTIAYDMKVIAAGLGYLFSSLVA